MLWLLVKNRDFVYILRIFASFTLYYMAFLTGKRIKEAGVLSTTTGFTIYLSLFSTYHLFGTISIFYPELALGYSFDLLTNTIMLLGMTIFIILNEIDEVLHTYNIDTKKRFKYPFSVISTIGIITLLLLFLYSGLDLTIAFIFILIPFIITSNRLGKRFETLEIVKKSNPLPWFYSGLVLTGFSNFLNNQILFNLLGYWILIVTTICLIVGGMLMTRGWNRLPSLSEFEWMIKMERLFVIHLTTSSVIYEYNFQTSLKSNADDQVEGDLAGDRNRRN